MRSAQRAAVCGIYGSLAAIGVYAFVGHVTASARTMENPLLAFDPFGLYYPMLQYGYSVLQTGHLPLWNPYQMAGLPFLAAFYPAILYPLDVLYLFLPVQTAMLVLTAAHVVLAGITAALYARGALRASAPAALAAGVVFMMNSWTLWAFIAQNQLYSIPWIPLLFLAADRGLVTSDPRWAVVLAVAIAMPILGGNLQTLSYATYALAPYVLACAWRQWRETSLSAVGRACAVLALGVVLGVALSAPQLFPTVELSNASLRSVRGLSPELIEPLGSHSLPSVHEFLDGCRQPLTFLFAGVVVFLVAPFSLVSAHRGRAIALLVAAVFTGLVAYGLSTPIGLAYVHLPMGRWFREFSRAWPVTMFCVAALTAAGLDTLVEKRLSRGGNVVLGATVVALVAGLVVVAPPRSRWGLLLAALIILIMRVRLFAERRVVWALGIVALVVLDFDSSVPVNTTVLPYTNEQHQALYVLSDAIQGGHLAQPATRSVHEGQVFNVSTTPKLGTLFRVPTFDDNEPFVPPRYRDWGMRMTGVSTAGGWDLQSATFDPRFLDYAAVGSIVLVTYSARQPPPSVAGLAPPLVMKIPSPAALGARAVPAPPRLHPRDRMMLPGGTAYVFANTHAWPRTFVANEVRIVGSPREALDALSGLPRDTRPLAIIEAQAATDVSTIEGSHGTATLVTAEAERVVVRARTEGPAILVLLDTNLPGWFADVDGVETRILQTNYLFRGVRVPAGEHTVTFRYAPLAVRLGLLVGIGGWIFAFTVVARGARTQSGTGSPGRA